MMRIGIDIGGTFTDLVLEDDQGTLHSWKVESTPPNFAEGVLNAIDLAGSELGLPQRQILEQTTHFIHGSTVTTNVVLTRTGERVGIITTRGFRNLYPHARAYRGHEQDPAKITHPVPLVVPEDIEEVTERVDYAGRVVAPLNEQELTEAIERLLGKGIGSIAICFLWSFRNPVHEQRAKKAVLRLAPDAYVSASYEACPVAGEYERTSTTVINAYAGPALLRYAEHLDRQLRESGLRMPLLIMKADGGPASIESAVTVASQTVYSGPAAGVVASRFIGSHIGATNLITFDMGGTSTDVALVYEGQLQTTSLQFVERQALAAPMIDVTSVGAGGGSIGWAGPAETLRAGPQSASAIPGPACYGKGGTDPAITDANVMLGLIDPNYFLGGRIPLDRRLAEQAISALGQKVGLTPERTAYGLFRVINAVMADAIRLRTVYKGLDPRDFSLVSFGGGGGLHCAALASELGIRRVIIPNMAPVFSALGLLSCDLTYSLARSTAKRVGSGGVIAEEDLGEINEIFHELDRRAQADLDAHGIAPSDQTIIHNVEMSYRGQILNFEVEAPSSTLAPKDIENLTTVFDERYKRVYGPGAAASEAGYTLKTYKVVGIGRIARPALTSFTRASAGNNRKPKGYRTALANLESDELADVAVFDGLEASPGAEFAGPAIIEFPDTNILVPVGFHARVDQHRNISLERE